MKPRIHKHLKFEDWAAAAILLSQGQSQNEMLNLLHIELPVWHQSNEYWNQKIEQDSNLARRYSEIFNNPYQGVFAHLDESPTSSITIDQYYEIFQHLEEVQKLGIDFLHVLEEHYNMTWNQWSRHIQDMLSRESTTRSQGTSAQKKALTREINEASAKWQKHWKYHYQKEQLELSKDIQF